MNGDLAAMERSTTSSHDAADSSAARDDSPAAISVQNVSKCYRKPTWFLKRGPQPPPSWALQNVSFDIRPGEMVGLLGPNGAGKTTLLKTMTTLLYPSSGRVLIHGHDVRHSSAQVRRISGLVTCDERSFYWRLSGRQNLQFFATLYGLKEATSNDRIDLLLGKLGLDHAADRAFSTYSAGMKQKLAIARGLLADPKIVFYDEPTRSLDPLSCQNIRKWIMQTREEHPDRTHLLATNQLDEAEQLCDRVVIINRGRLIAGGSIPEVRRRFEQREYELRHITYTGANVPAISEPNVELGLLEIERERVQGEETTIRIRTRKRSHAFSWVLEQILKAGGTVIDCDTDKVPFDEVFCSLVLGSQEQDPDSAPTDLPAEEVGA